MRSMHQQGNVHSHRGTHREGFVKRVVYICLHAKNTGSFFHPPPPLSPLADSEDFTGEMKKLHLFPISLAFPISRELGLRYSNLIARMMKFFHHGHFLFFITADECKYGNMYVQSTHFFVNICETIWNLGSHFYLINQCEKHNIIIHSASKFGWKYNVIIDDDVYIKRGENCQNQLGIA